MAPRLVAPGHPAAPHGGEKTGPIRLPSTRATRPRYKPDFNITKFDLILVIAKGVYLAFKPGVPLDFRKPEPGEFLEVKESVLAWGVEKERHSMKLEQRWGRKILSLPPRIAKFRINPEML